VACRRALANLLISAASIGRSQSGNSTFKSDVNIIVCATAQKCTIVKVMKPIFPSEDMTTYQKQRCGLRYKDEVIKSTKQLLKTTTWRGTSSWIFKAEAEWYFTTFITGGYIRSGEELKPMIIKSTFGVKPMSIDVINWEIQGLLENVNKPLSFRSNAAHKLPALTTSEIEVDGPHSDLDESAKCLRDLILTQENDTKNKIKEKMFSDLIKEQKPDAHINASYWTALISEGRGQEALKLIKEHYFHPNETNENIFRQSQRIVSMYETYIMRRV